MADTSTDPLLEMQVMKVMLNTVVYAHTPREEKPGALRFVQFVRPDNGQTVLPFFSDRTKAIEAAAGKLNVLPILGRNLFAYTLGATLMLDPNERECVFNPEEIRALLSDGSTGINQPWKTDAETEISLAEDVPPALVAAIQSACRLLQNVSAAYIAFAHWEHSVIPGLLVAIVAHKSEREHVVRAVSASLQPHTVNWERPIDILILSPSTTEHAMIDDEKLIYRRTDAAT
jgi:hypothetical protein